MTEPFRDPRLCLECGREIDGPLQVCPDCKNDVHLKTPEQLVQDGLAKEKKPGIDWALNSFDQVCGMFPDDDGHIIIVEKCAFSEVDRLWIKVNGEWACLNRHMANELSHALARFAITGELNHRGTEGTEPSGGEKGS